jgi:hypothetical protein
MLDLEMLGVEPDGFICAIGAVTFDANAVGLPFYGTITSRTGNGTLDAATIFWWLKQPKEAQTEFERMDVRYETLAHALQDFSRWVTTVGAQFIWSNGTAEDGVWLRQAYKRNALTAPLDFRQSMCYRTIKNLHHRPGDQPEDGTYHNALSDATWQAQHLINMNARVGGLIL